MFTSMSTGGFGQRDGSPCRLSNGTLIVVPAAETTTKCAGETCSSSSSNNNVTTTNASTSIGNELREYCKIVI